MSTGEENATPTKNMIVLKTSDEQMFEIEEKIAVGALSIKHMIEDDCANNIIPIPNVNSKIMAKVIEYLKKHVEAGDKASNGGEAVDGKAFDIEFMKVDQETLFDIIHAANYLNIKSLLDLCCQTVADMMKGKTPDEIRAYFHIKNDYTREEEEEVRRENAWAFEP